MPTEVHTSYAGVTTKTGGAFRKVMTEKLNEQGCSWDDLESLSEGFDFRNERHSKTLDAGRDILGEAKNWPDTSHSEEEEDEEVDIEPQDMENLDIEALDNDHIIIMCGGDWQSPLTLHIGVDSEDNLAVYSAELTELSEEEE